MGHAYSEGDPIPPELQLVSPVPLCPRPDKVRYKDEADALQRASRVGHIPGRPMLHAYRCECSFWHLSHMSRLEHLRLYGNENA